ncbi:MAG TPA: acyl-CoA dehydrogenase family protein [Longimicrobiales bacterium]|nr:acyl-CoA dehydrogenase family protein [Longimicrobiales bacterium]
MPDTTYLDWPFFDEAHRELARRIRAAAPQIGALAEDADTARAMHALVRALGAGGWLAHVVPAAYGGARDRLDVRSICILREHLAYEHGLADFAFAMQGLGSGSITEFGTDAQRARYLPPVLRGDAIAAFAISERDAGSDLAAMRTTAHRDGDAFVINGEKTWISNAGIAHHYVVVTRYPEAGERGFAAFIVDADAPGLSVTESFEVNAPHVLGTLAFNGCRVPADALVGEAGGGMRVALGTLDIFRTTVAAAALGLARRALDEALTWTRSRTVMGRPLSGMQMTQARLADMALAIDASALLVYRAAWTRDGGAARVTREAAMAKLHATESAQRVIDDAVQLLGARGVMKGAVVERLYQEIRALRIYEGTSEIQKIVIAGQVQALHEREAAATSPDTREA